MGLLGKILTVTLGITALIIIMAVIMYIAKLLLPIFVILLGLLTIAIIIGAWLLVYMKTESNMHANK